MNSQVDVRDILPSVRVPSLIIHRTGDRDSNIEEGRFISQQIPGARFVELSGEDHVPSVNPDQILDPVEEFLTGIVTPQAESRKLVTILFVDIVDSTGKAVSLGDKSWSDAIEHFLGTARKQIDLFGGRYIKSTGDGFLAVFDGPARAVRCAASLCGSGQTLAGENIRCGLHTAEVQLGPDDLTGIGVHIAARILEAAAPSEVWVSRTVKDLIAGSEIRMEERGEFKLRGLDDPWKLFAAFP